MGGRTKQPILNETKPPISETGKTENMITQSEVMKTHQVGIKTAFLKIKNKNFPNFRQNDVKTQNAQNNLETLSQ